VLALAGQCSRLGAPARDRRLAAIRLAGATPRQAVAVAVAETVAASGLGSVLGLVAYLLIRWVAHRPDELGHLPLPTDVLPPLWALAVITLGVPALAGGAAALMLRRVTFGPFGVVGSVRRTGAPGPWPALLIGLGFAAFAVVPWLDGLVFRGDQGVPRWIITTVLVVGGALATLGVVLGTAWLAYAAGRVLHRFARGPAALLAARRLLADPWRGSRTFAALLAAVVVGGGAVAQREYFEVHAALQEEEQRVMADLTGEPYHPVNDGFYLRSMDLVDVAVAVGLIIAAAGLIVAVAEGIVSRRRTYAALVAAGVPRRVLARAVLWQAMAPVVPAVLVALTVGALLQRTTGTEVATGTGSMSRCEAPGDECANPATAERYTRTIEFPELVRAVPVPVEDLALLGGLALLAALATVAVGLLFLRGSSTVEDLRTA
jgi:hypothetical protein